MEDRIDNVVGRNIRVFRTAQNLSQKELGEKLAVTFQQIQKYENNINSLPTGRIRELCKVLGINPNTLFGWDQVGEELPPMTCWAAKMAMKLESLDPAVKPVVATLISNLSHIAAK